MWSWEQKRGWKCVRVICWKWQERKRKIEVQAVACAGSERGWCGAERAQASYTWERESLSNLSSSLVTLTQRSISGKFESIMELIEDYSSHSVYSSPKHWPVSLTNGSTNLLHHDIHLFFITNIHTHISRFSSTLIPPLIICMPHMYCTMFDICLYICLSFPHISLATCWEYSNINLNYLINNQYNWSI